MNFVTSSFMTNLRVFLGAHDATECPACAKTVPRRTTGMPGQWVFCIASAGEIVDELFVVQGLVAAVDACQALGTLDAKCWQHQQQVSGFRMSAFSNPFNPRVRLGAGCDCGKHA